MSVEMATVGNQSEPPTRALAPVENGVPVVSDLLAQRIGDLIAASESAARTIREEARVEAATLRRTATREAVAEAQCALARSAPEVEHEVAHLRAQVASLQGQVERLTAEVQLLSDGQPALPPAESPQRPLEHDRRAMLIALNMAGNGATREETARYLAENLDLQDCDDLLETVFRYVGPADPPFRPRPAR